MNSRNWNKPKLKKNCNIYTSVETMPEEKINDNQY